MAADTGSDPGALVFTGLLGGLVRRGNFRLPRAGLRQSASSGLQVCTSMSCGTPVIPLPRPARACLTDGLGQLLPANDPHARLARDVAEALTEAGLALHDCAPHHPRYRLGGVCLLPVPSRHNPDGQGRIAVSWTTHNLLALDWDRGREHQDTQQAMNRALASVLKARGYQVRPFGTGGASLVIGRRRSSASTAPRTRTSRGQR
jgi:hypothetical protein